jgi:hypothetical protein
MAQRRLHLFKAQLAKLPGHLLLCLAALEAVAHQQAVCFPDVSPAAARRKPVVVDPDTVLYQKLLWAFRQLEDRLRQENILELRPTVGIVWHESQWAEQLL